MLVNSTLYFAAADTQKNFVQLLSLSKTHHVTVIHRPDVQICKFEKRLNAFLTKWWKYVFLTKCKAKERISLYPWFCLDVPNTQVAKNDWTFSGRPSLKFENVARFKYAYSVKVIVFMPPKDFKITLHKCVSHQDDVSYSIITSLP
jgi:hypothetical protein